MRMYYLLPFILIPSLACATPSAPENEDVIISSLSLQKENNGYSEDYFLTGEIQNISGHPIKAIRIMINTYKDGKITGESSDTAFCINKNEKWISRFYLSGNQNPDSFRVTSIQIQDTPFTCLQNEAIPIN